MEILMLHSFKLAANVKKIELRLFGQRSPSLCRDAIHRVRRVRRVGR